MENITSKYYNLNKIRQALSEIFKIDFLEEYEVSDMLIQYKIKNNLNDYIFEDIETIPFKEIIIKRRIFFKSIKINKPFKITDEIRQKLNAFNELLELELINKYFILDNTFKKFRLISIEPLDLLPESEINNDKPITDSSIIYGYTFTFRFDPIIYINYIYIAKYNDKVIETFNNSVENLEFIYNEDYTITENNTHLSIYNHPFVIAREIIKFAFPNKTFIAVPDIKNGKYNIVHINNYKYCNILDTDLVSNYRQNLDYAFEFDNKMRNLLLNVPPVNNELKVLFGINESDLSQFNKLTSITYFPTKDISVSPQGNIISANNLNNNEDYTTYIFKKSINLGLIEIINNFKLKDYGFTTTFLILINEKTKYTNIYLELISLIYYINILNRYLIFPTEFSITDNKIIVMNAPIFVKKIEPELKYNPKNRIKRTNNEILNDLIKNNTQLKFTLSDLFAMLNIDITIKL